MRKPLILAFLIATSLAMGVEPVLAQRGRGGGGMRGGGMRGGGGGFSRPMGGMSRPSGGFSRPMGGMSRPSMPAARPNVGMNRPGGGMQRPAGGMQRPAGGMTRPNISLPSNRPNIGTGGGINRPGTMPGGISRPGTGGGMTRPGGIGGGIQRPGTLPGGGTRPGAGGITRPGGNGGGIQRPGTLPGGGTRPSLPGGIGGGGTRPPWGGGGIGGGGTRPSLPGGIGGGGNRPGGGGLNPGGGNRPGGGGLNPGGGNRPGGGGRPPWNGGGGLNPGGGNRPGGGGGRPPWNGGGGLNPGGGNRPGGGGNWNGGGNRPGGGGNWNGGGWNRPGGNWNNGNTNININRPNNINNWGGGNWGGGNWGGGNWGGGNWGGGNWGRPGGNTIINNNFYPGWSGGNYGNWYRGGWGYGNSWNGAFWGGFAGSMTGWGLSRLFSPGYMPMAWGAPMYGSWGLGGYANSWMYSGYTNPYVTPATQTVIVQQPIVVDPGAGVAQPAETSQPVVAYDYSKPIDMVSADPEQSVAEAAQKVFESARDQFKANNFGQALTLTDQALAQLPNDPTLHEFRSLCLFALKRYDEAAATVYAVLSAGPGWNWATMVGLYSSVDVYTAQIRDLEAYGKANPTSPAAQFLLGYHYMVQDHKDAAAARFAKVVAMQPNDQLAASFVKMLGTTNQAAEQPGQVAQAPPAAAAPSAGGAPAQAEKENLPPPPATLAGTWSAHPDDKVSIILTVGTDGTFTWAVTENGSTQTLQGQAGYKDDVLVLNQQSGPPLAGQVKLDAAGTSFTFKPPGSPENVPGLTFKKG